MQGVDTLNHWQKLLAFLCLLCVQFASVRETAWSEWFCGERSACNVARMFLVLTVNHACHTSQHRIPFVCQVYTCCELVRGLAFGGPPLGSPPSPPRLLTAHGVIVVVGMILLVELCGVRTNNNCIFLKPDHWGNSIGKCVRTSRLRVNSAKRIILKIGVWL